MNKPPLAIRALELDVMCEICGKARPKGKHTQCSKRRQQLRQQRHGP